MNVLLGYQILSQVYESANSLVYRGIREEDNQAVILKFLKEDYPTPEEIVRYKQEYQITRDLNIAGVVKAYSLEKYQNTLVILFEDFAGESLKILMNNKVFMLKEFLFLAIKITAILGEVHGSNIIHKDINPSNIVYNSDTQQLKLIDFGISTILSRENPILTKASVKNPNILEGTLAYISPEQTGRMNRLLDYRTDFYSLGATFYELLTNQLPFDTTDAMELVHCHIAKQPVPPHELNPDIPKPVSEIVMKLLAKTVEERYQSAWGIKADLEECLFKLQNNSQINTFALGLKDISDKFQIPQKLYGRERELENLLAAFKRVAAGEVEKTEEVEKVGEVGEVGGDRETISKFSTDVWDCGENFLNSVSQNHQSKSEMILVSGYSGIGKSALVQEIYKPITKHRSHFISGKFNQFQRNIPYSAIVSAFSNLVRQLLTETEASLAQWREKIQRALGANGQVIIDVIPEVELIVGKQPEIPDLAASEAQNRFNLVFQNFIRVFTQPEHPLVMFIDDLQWADVASLKLIKLLMSAPDSQYLLFIGAYRDNEVNPAHPLMLTIDEIRESGVRVEHIYLSPLDLSNVNHLISDTLKCSSSQTLPLAELVLLKTGGNPFFIQEFLKSLYSEKLIKFIFASRSQDRSQGRWQWDLEQIKAQGITDNVVDLMAGKIQKLSVSCQRVLQLAAAIGNQFDLETLAIVHEKPQRETAVDLQEAIVINLILPLSDVYKLIEVDLIGDSSLQTNQQATTIEYKFAHDRIQQAAYSLIPSKDKQAVHWQIGQLLLKNTPQQVREQKIFDIVNQLNFGIELISVKSEREQLVQLNLISAKKAKASAAYESAWNYLNFGMNCLSADSWQSHYNLTLALYVEAAEVASLSGNFEEMERLTFLVLQQAKTLLEKLKVYEIKIQSCIAHNQPLEAIEIALYVLKMLGVRFPKKPNQLNIIFSLLKTRIRLVGQRIEDLIYLPEMTEPNKVAAMRILSSVSSAAYFAAPELLPLIVFKQVNLSVKHGNTSVSSYAYATYGLILSGESVKDVNSGYKFGQIALSLLDKFNSKELKSRTLFIFNYFIRHWQDHLRETLAPLLDAYLIGLETGDLEYATYSASAYSYYSLVMGKELPRLEQEMAKYSNAFRQLNQDTLFYFNQLHRQVVLNLMDRAEDKCRLVGESYDEIKMLPIHIAANTTNICHSIYFHKLYLGYLFQDYEQAIENAALVEKHLKSAVGSVPLSHFYNSLTHLAIYFDVSKSEQKRILKKIESNQKKLKKWAISAPMTHLHKVYLVEAERYRVLDHQDKARDCYDRAIELAKEHKYLNDEALAHELAAKFYLALDKAKIAQVYMLDARYCYRKWGAIAKVKDLETRYPQLFFKKSESKVTTPLSVSESNSSAEASEVLDLATVIKASQVISGEMMLDKLLTKLMKIMIENAGAQKGFLILEQAGKLLIEADGEAKDDSITVLQSIPIEPVGGYSSNCLLSSAIINYVARTKESVVLNDATHEGQFTKDSYIIQNQPKSILCVPLINQDKLISIVYLENNLTTAAFTPDRLEIIKLLSAQAAIAIANAKLYSDVKESESKLTQFNEALSRFVPRQFLQSLEKESIVDVKLGDSVQKEMSVLFSDIRDFTTLSESMSPEDNFKFINAYLSRMELAISAHQGFIDKYIGDAIMALFSGSADDAVQAGIAMLHRLTEYNQQRINSGYIPIQIGIGINTGSLMLGTVGGENRMNSTVISDAVNLASRVEGLTKKYGVSLLMSHCTFSQLTDVNQYAFRIIDRVQVKGKSKEVSVYEVFDADPPKLREGKLRTKTAFEQALLLYNLCYFRDAAKIFEEVLNFNPEDRAAQIYLERCQSINSVDISSVDIRAYST